MKKILTIIAFFGIAYIQGQKIHVHNDYEQPIPFWGAISAKADAIEADVILKNKQLFVAHEEKNIDKNRTLKTLYLEPIEKAINLGFISPKKQIQLLIDIKSEAYETLSVLENELKLFFSKVKSNNINIIISGNRPSLKDYHKYPDFIRFDYQEKTLPTKKEILLKIGLVSYNFKSKSVWNGKGKIIDNEYKTLQNLIKNVHKIQKPIRFWATPDSKSAWKVLADLQVDYINTDIPNKCADYLKTLPQRWFKNTVFSEVYKPTFKTDNKNLSVKNIILMIGDGNGLSQISSAVLANGGELTLTQLKSIGLMKTQSADDFTTDSAASATALATGYKTYNRAIGVKINGNKTENITEYLSKYGFSTGCITTDKIFGATPAAFYAHQKDRDFEKEISEELLTSNLTLFVGGGGERFKKEILKKHKFNIVNTIDDIKNNQSEKVGYFFSKGSVPSVLEGRKNNLAKATKNSLNFLSKKNKPFFIMIESAQIDSYGHHNNTGGIVTETIDFDRAITEAIRFADKDQQTLVIILADHETSGFAIPQGNIKSHHIEGSFITNDHTGMLVPVFAYGPKSYEFEGSYENNDIFKKIIKILAINE